MNDRSRHHPIALRSIAALEAVKGVLGLGAGCGLLSLRNTDLHAAADAFLLQHGLNPERHFMRLFIEGVARATNHHVMEIAALCFVYAAVRFIEGYGLWWEKRWAEWFAVVSAGIYLPLELTHFGRHPSLFNAAVILINMLIILYLASLLGQQRVRTESIDLKHCPNYLTGSASSSFKHGVWRDRESAKTAHTISGGTGPNPLRPRGRSGPARRIGSGPCGR